MTPSYGVNDNIAHTLCPSVRILDHGLDSISFKDDNPQHTTYGIANGVQNILGKNGEEKRTEHGQISNIKTTVHFINTIDDVLTVVYTINRG